MRSSVSAMLLALAIAVGTPRRRPLLAPNRSGSHTAPSESGAEEGDFPVLHRSGQRQRLARQGTKEIQV